MATTIDSNYFAGLGNRSLTRDQVNALLAPSNGQHSNHLLYGGQLYNQYTAPTQGDMQVSYGDANLGDYGVYQNPYDLNGFTMRIGAGDNGPGGAYGHYDYGLRYDPQTDSFTTADPTFVAGEKDSWFESEFIDKWAPILAGAAITGGAAGLFGAGGAPAAGALGVGADGMGAMALGTGGAGAAGTGAGLASGGANAFGESGTLLSNEAAAGAGWNSEIGLSGAAGDFGAASGVAAPAGYTGAAQTMAGTGLAQQAGTALTAEQLRNAAFGDPASNSSFLDQAGNLLNSRAGQALIGAGLGVAASQDPATNTTTTAPDPFRDYYRQQTQQVYGQPFTPYTGERVAGMTDAQNAAGNVFQQSVNNLPQTMGQINGLIGSGTTPLTSAQNGLLGQTQNYLSAATAPAAAAQNGLLGQTQNYFGQATQPMTAMGNAYAAQDNPYLQGTISAANRGLVDNYNSLVAPKYAQAGSYGSSALAEYENLDRLNLMRQMSDNANQLSYQGYNLGAQLAESGANRQDTLNNAVAGRALSAGQALGTLGESAAGRADSMLNALAGRQLSAGSLLGGLGEQAAGRADTIATGNANRYLQGAQQAQSAALLPNQIAQGLLGFGNQQQQTNQAQNDAAYQEFLRQVNYPREQLALLGAAAGMQNGTTTTQQQSQSPYAGALGGAVLGSQVYNWLNPQQQQQQSGELRAAVQPRPNLQYGNWFGY